MLGGCGSFFGDFLLWEGLFSCYAFIFFFFINYKGNFSGGIFLGDGRFWFFLGR